MSIVNQLIVYNLVLLTRRCVCISVYPSWP